MKTHILKWLRSGILVLCGAVASAAGAQDVERSAPAPTTGSQQTNGPQHEDTGASGASSSSGTEKEGADSDSSHSEEDSSLPMVAEAPVSRHHGHGDNVVSIGHDATLLAGERADSVVAVFGSATSDGDVSDSVVSVLGQTHVTGRVADSAVAVLGSVYVNGKVDGDVVSVLGNVELGPEAEVKGDVVVVGGNLQRDRNAVIHGGVQTVLGGNFAGFGWLRPWFEHCVLYGRPLAFAPGLEWAWGVALGFLALYVFLAFLFRGPVETCIRTLETQPGQSVLAALLTVLLAPMLFVLLLITILGIAAIPFLALGLLCLAIFGKVVVLASIGRRCTPFLASKPVAHTVLGVVVGSTIVLVLYTIPVVGLLLYKLLGILGLGVVIYTILLSVRAGRQARAAAGPTPGMGPGGPAVPGDPAGTGGSVGPGPTATGGFAASAFGPTGASGSSAPDYGAVYSGTGPGGTGPGTSNPGSTTGASGFGAAGVAMGAGPMGPTGAAYSASSASLHYAALPRAGFVIRIGALFLDLLIVAIVFNRLHEGYNLHLIVLAAYGAIMWKLKSATIGGIVCGIQVVRLDGRPMDWTTAIVRALSCFLSLAAAGLGFIWIALDAEKQAWHDKIAGTIVVRPPKGASLL